MALVLHMTAEERSRLWHGFAGHGGAFSRGERVETRTLLRSVEGQILSVSDIGMFQQSVRSRSFPD
jgi:hypothetical protein